jgi:hypothetical protein
MVSAVEHGWSFACAVSQQYCWERSVHQQHIVEQYPAKNRMSFKFSIIWAHPHKGIFQQIHKFAISSGQAAQPSFHCGHAVPDENLAVVCSFYSLQISCVIVSFSKSIFTSKILSYLRIEISRLRSYS